MDQLHFFDDRQPTLVFVVDSEKTAFATLSYTGYEEDGSVAFNYEELFDHGYDITPEMIDCLGDQYALEKDWAALSLKIWDSESESNVVVYRTNWGWLFTWNDEPHWYWKARYIIDEHSYFEVKWRLDDSIMDFGWQSLHAASQPLDTTSVMAQAGRCFEKQDRECLHHVETARTNAISFD